MLALRHDTGRWCVAEGVKLLTPVSSKPRRGPSLIRYSLSQQSSLLEIGGGSSFAALGDRMGAGVTAMEPPGDEWRCADDHRAGTYYRIDPTRIHRTPYPSSSHTGQLTGLSYCLPRTLGN